MLPLLAILFFLLSILSILLLVWALKKDPDKLKTRYERLYLQKQELLLDTQSKNISRISGMVEEIKMQSQEDILEIYRHISLDEWETVRQEREKLEALYQNLVVQNFCDNEIINAAIHPKYQYCRNQKIAIDISFTEFKGIKIDELLLVCILSNLMDNGIEAVEKMEPMMERYVGLSVTKKSGFLFIHFENSKLSGNSVQRNHTSKGDLAKHGYGLQIIEEIVGQYDGRCKITESENSVAFDIALRNTKAIQKKRRKSHEFMYL